MVQCWYMADTAGQDQRQPLQLQPPMPVSLEVLAALGVLYWKLDPDNCEKDGSLQKIRDERNYNYTDVIEIDENLPEYEKKLKMFFQEHLHKDEEIRFILAGSGYFDVRDKSDRWIRIAMEKGDMIVLPAGMYHRFTLDEKDYVKAMRLFVGEPVWTPYNRPEADELPVRQQYVQSQA